EGRQPPGVSPQGRSLDPGAPVEDRPYRHARAVVGRSWRCSTSTRDDSRMNWGMRFLSTLALLTASLSVAGHAGAAPHPPRANPSSAGARALWMMHAERYP